MASNAYIGQIKTTDDITCAIGSTAYAVCSTAQGTAAKVADIPGFTLLTGATVHIKFTNTNTASAPTLNISSSGAKSIVNNGTSASGTNTVNSWPAGAVVSFTYDGSYWVKNYGQIQDNNTDTNTQYSAGSGLALSGTTFNHSNSISASSVGSAQSPSHGGTFAIPKITYDAQGHITKAETVNITLPADNNTDTKVTQTKSTTANWAKVLVSSNTGAAASTAITSGTTAIAYYNDAVAMQPSTGAFRATTYNVADKVNLEYDATNQCLNFVFI